MFLGSKREPNSPANSWLLAIILFLSTLFCYLLSTDQCRNLRDFCCEHNVCRNLIHCFLLFSPSLTHSLVLMIVWEHFCRSSAHLPVLSSSYQDCLYVSLYRSCKDKFRSGDPKKVVPLEDYLGTESGFGHESETNTLAVICKKNICVFAFDTREILAQWKTRLQSHFCRGKRLFHSFLLSLLVVLYFSISVRRRLFISMRFPLAYMTRN